MIYAVIEEYSGHQANIKANNLEQLKKFIDDSQLYKRILSVDKSAYRSSLRLRKL